MNKTIFLFVLCIYTTNSFAQKESYELTSYKAPKGWKKEVKTNSYTSYTITNKQKKTYCQIFIMASTATKGGIKEDFESEWQNLVAKQYNVTDTPQTTQPSAEGGWQMKGGMAAFTFNNGTSTAMLTTMSGYNKAVSIVAVTNSTDYIPAIQQLVESVEMKKPSTDNPVQQQTTQSINQPTGNSKFAFNTTNFDDGWTGTVQEDWVEVTKGTTRVLIHYPNKQADKYNSALMDGLKNAWNILVAPRYSSASNFEFKPITGWQSIEFAEADAVEKNTGKTVHVVLFKINYSNGSGKYLEFITPDKNAFEQEFGAYHATSYGWEKMENMAFRNKFAIAASDLQGKWTNDFSGAIQYVNAYTGFDAGMDTHASVEIFQIGPGNAYKWDLGVASGQVGNIKFQSVKSSGKFSMIGNWQINFSDMEGKPRTFDAHFSCIKGLRILWLGDRAFAKVE
jgi:hypothetical protein